MPHVINRHATALIDHIQTRFHEGQRRALPGLLAMAAAVEQWRELWLFRGAC